MSSQTATADQRRFRDALGSFATGVTFAVANVLTGRASAVDKLLRGPPFAALLGLGRYVAEDRILPAYRAAPPPRRRRALTRAPTSSFSKGGVPSGRLPKVV